MGKHKGLLVAQYPHLCIIEDWLEETVMTKTSLCTAEVAEKTCTVAQFKEGNVVGKHRGLLVAQYPHLCIIEDWLEETVMTKTSLCTVEVAEVMKDYFHGGLARNECFVHHD